MLWEKEGAFSIFQNFRCDIPDFQYVAMKRLSLSRRRNYSSKTYDFAGRSKTHLMEQEASKTGNRIWGKWNNCNFRSNVNGLSVVGERGGGCPEYPHVASAFQSVEPVEPEILAKWKTLQACRQRTLNSESLKVFYVVIKFSYTSYFGEISIILFGAVGQ